MYTIFQGESLLIPAAVTGTKAAITSITAEIKAAVIGGGIPGTSDPVLGTFSVSDYTSPEVTDGYLFSLANTSSLEPGVYYVNYKYVVDSKTFKGVPKKVIIKESVI